jgi:hypothetical protein
MISSLHSDLPAPSIGFSEMVRRARRLELSCRLALAPHPGGIRLQAVTSSTMRCPVAICPSTGQPFLDHCRAGSHGVHLLLQHLHLRQGDLLSEFLPPADVVHPSMHNLTYSGRPVYIGIPVRSPFRIRDPPDGPKQRLDAFLDRGRDALLRILRHVACLATCLA